MEINLREKLVKGRITVCGEVIYMDTKFVFNVHRAAACKSDYSFVLKVNAIDPETGKILQMTGKKLSDKIKKVEKSISEIEECGNISSDNPKLMQLKERKAKLLSGARLDELNATLSTYLKDDRKKTIKRALEAAVPKLYSKYSNDISKSLKISEKVSDIHPLTAFEMHQNDFFSKKGRLSEKTLKAQKNALRNICEMLNEKTISEITVADVEKVSKLLKGDKKAKLNCAESFFAFCGEAKVYSGANPITVYKEGHHVKRTSGKNYPDVPWLLLPEEERRLHEEMEKDLFTDLGLAVPLGKGARMSVARMLELRWKDITIDSDGVRIQAAKDQLTGATTNYVRPPTKEVADLIVKKRGELIKKHGKSKLQKMKVLIFEEGTTEKQKKAAITNHIYEVLRRAGITREKIRSAVDSNNPKKAGGTGLSLLQKHYDYALKEYGGVNLHSGVGLFLRGMRIYDTTSDSYRCFTDETGNYYLQVIMRRIDVCAENKSNDNQRPITSKLVSSGCREITVAAIDHEIRTGVKSKKMIRIPKGTIIVVKSKFGVRGSVRFKLAECADDEHVRYQNIY